MAGTQRNTSNPESDLFPDWLPKELQGQFIKPLRSLASIAEGHGPPGYTPGHSERQNAEAWCERLYRLLTDPRMDVVYRTLLRHRRENHKPTDKLEFAGTHHRHRSHAEAVGAFIIYASGTTQVPWISKAALNKQKRSLDRAITALHRAATDAYRPDVKETLEQCAIRCEHMTESNYITLGRVNGQAQVNAYIKMLAQFARRYFDKPLYGTVATVANVALNRNNITTARVRKLTP